MADRVINLKGRGLRGESVGDVARRTGTFLGADISPGMSDAQVMDAGLGPINELVEAAGVPAQYADVVAASSTNDGNITLSGEQLLGGVDVVDGDRVLLIAQTAPAQNGLWIVHTGAWARPTDFDGAGEAVTGATVQVLEGVQAGLWRLTTQGAITIGTTAQTWRAFSYRSADKVTTRQDGPGALTRSARAKLNDILTFKDYGAIADGASHPLSERYATLGKAQADYPFVISLSQEIDWAAMQAAVNLFPLPGQDDPVDPATCGGTIYGPRGVYFLGDDTVTIRNDPTHPLGSYSFGPKLRGDRAVLVPGANSMGCLALIGGEAGSDYVGGCSVEGFHFDCSPFTEADAVGLLLRNVYMSDFRDLTFRGGGGPGQSTHHIWLDESGSSVSFYDSKLGNIRITGKTLLGASPPLIWTTINWYNCWFTFMEIAQAWDVSVFGGGAQSGGDIQYCYKLTNFTDLAVWGGDYESSAPSCVFVDCSVPGPEGVQNLNLQPNATGSLQGGFIRGEAVNAFMPRQNGKPYGGWNHGTSPKAVNDAGATEILNFKGDPKISGNNFTMAVVQVFGSNGSFAYCDEVIVGYTGFAVRASTTIYGSPPTRAYSFDASSAGLKLQLGSGGAAHFVRAVASPRVPYV